MKNTLRYIAVIFLLLVTNSLFGQSSLSVKVRLSDANSSEPVAFATVSITPKGESQAIKYALTDDKGFAHITRVAKGTYVLKAEIMGYKTHTQEIVLNKSIDLGEIKMAEDAVALDASKVSAVGNPIVIKKDTIEYNASSFKTSENDMLEQLLKKLPGVEVDSDGTITANGETIKEITIDGKTFFLDDPQLASKNIPAKLIEKVKVVEKKSDQAEFTGIDDGEEETVIDLKLRPGMAEGWFGNVMGGGGHDVPGAGLEMNDWRYQGAAMIGRFTDNSQISIILNGNNTNNRGFNDVAGGMMQGMRGGRGMGGRGGGGNTGISTTWMGGLNGAFTLCDGNMDLGANYLYNGSNKDIEEASSKITYLDDDTRLLYDSKGISNTMSQGHRAGVSLDHKFSENTSILFEPQFNYGTGHFFEQQEFETRSTTDAGTDTLDVNRGYSRTDGFSNNWNTSGSLLFRQRLGKPGRTFSANVYYNISNNRLSGFNQSQTFTDENGDGVWDSDGDRVNQRYDQRSDSYSVSARAVYTEPLTDYLFLEANYQYSWSKSKSDKLTYDSPSFDTDAEGRFEYNNSGETLNQDYSNVISNVGIAQRAGLNLSFQKKKFRAQLGAAINPTTTKNHTNGADTTIRVINWSPQAMLFYDINENTNLRMFYFGRSSQPSTTQLMPVLDNSDPLNLSLGNPYLAPYFNHNVRMRFGYTNKKTFTSVNANFRATIVQNAISSAQWYDNAGVQYSLPVNSPLSTTLNGRVFVNSPFGKSNFSIFSMTFFSYKESTSYIGKSNMDMTEYFKDKDGNPQEQFNYALFHSRYPDLHKADEFVNNLTQTLGFTQRLRFTYRSDLVEVTLGARTRMNKSWYTVNEMKVAPTWNNQVDASMNWTIPGGVNLVADVDYNWYNGYTTPQKDEVILNAEISKLLFKNRFTIAVKAYDILGQAKSLSVTDAANYHQETRNNTLGRYIILSLTYRFGNFNSAGGGKGRGPMYGPRHR